jgi:NADH-quinone oxidoreductase subunit M
VLPWFAFFFVIVAMGSVALPSTGSFIGEWLILIGAFQASPVIGTVATLGVIFGAVYILWLTYKILFGPLDKPENKQLSGLNRLEVAQLSILSILIFVLGFASSSILEHSKPTLLKIERSVISQTYYASELTNLKDSTLMPLNTKLKKNAEGVK